MKSVIVGLVVVLIMAVSASAGVPDDIATLMNRMTAVEQTDVEQEAKIASLEQRVARLERRRVRYPYVVCRVIAGHHIPAFCYHHVYR